MLLGQHAGHTETPVRPHGLRDDDHRQTRHSPRAAQRQTQCRSHSLNDTMAMEPSVQTDLRNRTGHTRSDPYRRLQIGRNDTSRRNTAPQRQSAIRAPAPLRQNSPPSQPRVSSPMIRLSNSNALFGASSQKCSYCAALSTPAPGVSLTTRKQKNGTARKRHV